MQKKAPWQDRMGENLYEGDMIKHPSGVTKSE